MKGMGTKITNNGAIEISGFFDGNGLVHGKGSKKWKKRFYEQQQYYPYKKIKNEETYFYRGNLKDS